MVNDNLTKQQLEIIAKAVLKEHKRITPEKDQRDWRLRNTRLLLKNYRWLQKHCEEIIDDLDNYENVIFDPEELNLKALMKYKAKTKKMLDYFDATWGSYYAYCKNNGIAMQRRSEVLNKLYLSQNKLNKVDLAELYNVDESTIRRDESRASKELSIFLFGIDSLDDLEQIVFTH